MDGGLTEGDSVQQQPLELRVDPVSGAMRVVALSGDAPLALDGYTIANLRSAYALKESLEFFGRVDNLFAVDYSTFGVLAEVELVLEEVPGADNPRFVSPGSPRSVFVGARVKF